tara:strand:+ start:15830 stop:16555 length:726 start_codon:yes stop_codon:yes gene_type:complete
MPTSIIKSAILATPLTLAVLLAACSDSNTNTTLPVSLPGPAPTPAPGPAPTPAPTGFNVQACLDQVIPGTGGTTVAGAVIPDTLTLNLAVPSGFPNGRRLEDPVIDVTLAVIFLDLATHSPALFAGLPLNPGKNDVTNRTAFPYLAKAQGTPPLSGTAGVNFNFNNGPVAAFARVDRMGMPAVSTALIGSSRKNSYNDADPSADVNGDFVPDLVGQLTGLTNALADDLTGLGLTPCAVPNT